MHLLIRGGWFGRGNLQQRLRVATGQLRAYCKRAGVKTALRCFSQDNLVLKAGSFPELRSKGADSTIILQWLAEELADVQDPQFANLSALVCLGHMFIWLLCGGPAFCDRQRADQMLTTCEGFMKLYLLMHHQHPAVFKIRPKWHLTWHLGAEASLRPSGRNPSADSTWVDEDYMKKLSRLIRKLHRKTSAHTALSRYLIMIGQKLRLHMG